MNYVGSEEMHTTGRERSGEESLQDALKRGRRGIIQLNLYSGLRVTPGQPTQAVAEKNCVWRFAMPEILLHDVGL